MQEVAAGEAGDERVGGPRDELLRACRSGAGGRRGSRRSGRRASLASRKSWVTIRVGIARPARISASSSRTAARVWASSADSGSSSSSTAGSRASARATRDALALAAGQPARLLAARGGRSAAARAARRRARPRRRTRRSPRTVMCGNSAYSWNTSPTERRSGGRSMPRSVSSHTSSPSAIRPRAGRRSPATARRIVVLPAPDGPTSANGLRADAQAAAELERAKGIGEVELERRHESSL